MKLNKLLLVACLLIAALFYGLFSLTLPRIARVIGYVTTTVPPVKVHSSALAIVVSIQAKNGDVVDMRASLLRATTERTQGQNSVEVRHRAMLIERLNQFNFEAARATDAGSAQTTALQARVLAIQRELDGVGNELAQFASRAELSKAQLARYKQLHAQGFVSLESVSAKQADAADMAARMFALERTSSVLERELATVQLEIKTTSQKTATQLSQYKREKLVIQQDLNESEAKQIEIVSPVRGIVSQLNVQPGQLVRTDIPVAVIIPTDAQYELQLLVPSRSVGFVVIGQDVSVRYQAFPHEHYGRHVGKVKDISQVALMPNELPNHIPISNEPQFMVKVALPATGLQKNGTIFNLSPGMLAEADIQLDRLKIYQWLLQPLYRLGGRL